jgi:hypothetical protein
VAARTNERVTVTLPADLAEAGFEDWVASLPEEDATGPVDLRAGKEVRWVPGEGWAETGA